MTAGLRGNPANLRALATRLRELPTVVAQAVARDVAPVVTRLAAEAYTSGMTVYGEPRPSGVKGNPLDLFATGKTQETVRFVAIGTVVRCQLGPRWARYLVGKYSILPTGALPVAWSAAIGAVANETIEEALIA